RALDLDVAFGERFERVAPDVEDRVGAHERVAQRSRLLEVELRSLRAILGGAQVEVARDAQQLARGDRLPRTAAARRDVRLDRAEIAAAVEDDGDRLADRKAA